MDFDQYVAARYGRLIEHAVALGCAQDEAPAYVDRVLAEHRRQIRRAEDPDPLVIEALELAVTGTSRRRPPSALAALGLVAVAIAAGGTIATPPPAKPVPSLFALDGTEATRLLEEHGYQVELLGTGACEPLGLVLGSDPATGQAARRGATVRVQTAKPSAATCHGQYDDRRDAWRFVTFALGGPPPELAGSVRLFVDRDAPVTLEGDEARDPGAWGRAFDLIQHAARTPAQTSTGMPALRVDPQVPPHVWCDVPRPPEVGERSALRIQLDRKTRNDEGVCPLTVDLYRSGEIIDTVVVYSAKYQSGELTFAGVP